jgi:hypothetical protein
MVNVAIVFAVDRSSSISAAQMTAQRMGHANALRSPAFLKEVISGGRCVGIHYLEWSGVGDAHTVVPWTKICSQAEAEQAATDIEQRAGQARASGIRPRSSLSFAIDSARAALKTMPFVADKKIISLSTNGSSNDGVPPLQSRDRAKSDNYIVNAIALAPDEPGIEPDLSSYLRHNVITGDGSFAVAAQDLDEYAQLMIQKTVLEAKGQQRRRVNAPPMSSAAR